MLKIAAKAAPTVNYLFSVKQSPPANSGSCLPFAAFAILVAALLLAKNSLFFNWLYSTLTILMACHSLGTPLAKLRVTANLPKK